MKVEYINPFLTSTISVFDTMLQCKLSEGPLTSRTAPNRNTRSAA